MQRRRLKSLSGSRIGDQFFSLVVCLLVFSRPAFSDAASDDKTPTQEAAGSGGQSVMTAQDFTDRVVPILKTHCYSCHGPEHQEHSLRLDTFDGFVVGGKAGPPVVPGQPDASLLMAAVRYQDESLQMPPDGKLAQHEIETLNAWVTAGAPHPGGTLSASETASNFDPEEARQFWSLQPLHRPDVPSVEHPEFVAGPIDSFVVAALEQQGIAPGESADKQTLIRRATFDLTGLPPTPAEISSFLADESPKAFATVIDRLLQSPHYGECWGKHWLDIVRYADSNGLDENVAHGHGWKYRDYVIASFNNDKPFDQFLREQLAGDLLAKMLPTDDPSQEAKRLEMLTATGFLTLGPKVLAEADQTKMLMDIIDEQIDTTGKAFLGMTFGCARCHNHKFDPVSQSDYYAMVGIFRSTVTMESLKTVARWNENDVATSADRERQRQQQLMLETTKSEIARLTEVTTASLAAGARSEDQFPQDVRDQLAKLRAEQSELEKTMPTLPTAMGVKDGTPENARINIRGSHLMLGRPVRRGIPVVLEIGQPLEIPDSDSGRLQLASWLTDPRHPLTARVMANRVWRWHFGRGIVASTDNFGLLGERPTNQPLLDWLSSEFISSGWSMKELHRTIMLSRTWQLSSDTSEHAAAKDPAGLLHWRFGHRRLEAEAIRDSVLAVSGLLDTTMGGSLLHVGNREFVFNHTSKDETKYDSLRRSVYLPVIRNNLYDGFSLFDATDCAVANGDRATSTVASQALYMMNSDLLLKASRSLAAQLLRDSPDDPAERVQMLFQQTLGRSADSQEVAQVEAAAERLRAELQSASGTEQDQEVWSAIVQAVLASNEFVYVR